MEYRRAKVPGATYFFTVVTYQRQNLFQHPQLVTVLRQSVRSIKQRHQFIIEAMVVLPDHLHCIWTLPNDDANFSMRWQLIKSAFSRRCPDLYRQHLSSSRHAKGEQGVWQRRFWEHKIQDEQDFAHHVDYIHYNPVKHGLVSAPNDWMYSSFHRYVQSGCYQIDWGANDELIFNPTIGHE
jgi:putative transposase